MLNKQDKEKNDIKILNYNSKKENVDIKDLGFIMGRNGEYVKLKTGMHHPIIINEFLNRFLKNNPRVEYNLYEGMQKLSELGFVNYMGTAVDDDSGYGIFIFPKDYKLSDIQLKFVTDLIKTNYNIDTGEEIYELKLTDLCSDEIILPEFFNIVNVYNNSKQVK